MGKARWWAWRSGRLLRDGQVTLRRLLRAPGFVAATVCTLTVGLGTFAVVYTAYQKILVEPLPYERPDELYYAWRDYTWFNFERGWLGPTDIAEFQTAGGIFEGAAGMLLSNGTLSSSDDADPFEIPVASASPNVFDLLGVQPVLGRGFAPDEVGPDRPQVVVLTHRLWQRLGGDPTIVGTDLTLNENPWTVIGVLGPDFRFVRHSSMGSPQPVDAFTTLNHHLAEGNPNNGSYAGLIRVRTGTPPEAVEAAVAAVGSLIDERDFDSQGLRLYPVGVREDLVAPARPALTVLLLAGVFLVLVLMVNLATLLLARAARRERELAVSRALGASPAALARPTILEGAALGLLGGVGAVAVGVFGTRALVALAPLDLPRRDAIALDWPIGLLVLATGLIVGLAAGIGPGVWAARTNLGSLLGVMGVRGGGGRARTRRGLVVIQVALSLVLLTAGGLVVRSFDQLLRVDPGFDPAGLLTVRIPITGAASPGAEGIHALHDRIQNELAALPGVISVGAAPGLPLTGTGASQTGVTFPGAPGITGDSDVDAPLVDWTAVRAGYFEAIGARLLEGRTFDGPPREGVTEIVIDRTLARQFFPTSSAIGATATFGSDGAEVIGVVDHIRRVDIHREGLPQVWLRNDAEGPTWFSMSWVIRTRRPPMSHIPEVRNTIRAIDPRLPLEQVRTMDEIVGDALRQQRISAVLIGGISLGALLLAAMGLFGLMSGTVTRRRHELAVRIALGAGHDRILRLVMREGAALIAIGLLIGIPGVFLSGRFLQGMLYGVSPFDPLTLIAVAFGLTGVALAATYLPARRVLGIEPAGVLREE
jgi:putative ABC transport system permease protein